MTRAARRWRSLLRTELLLLLRHRALAAVAVVTALWLVVLLALPQPARRALLPWILFLDVTGLGFFFIPALVLLERSEGTAAALRVTPLHRGEYLAVRVGLPSALSVAAAAVLLATLHLPGTGTALLGVALLAVLFGLLAYALAAGIDSFPALMVRMPAVAIPLLLPALLWHSGILQWPILLASPATTAMVLVRGELSLPALAGSLLWLGAALALALGAWNRGLSNPARRSLGSATSAGRGHPPILASLPGRYRRLRALRSYLRTDSRSLLRQPVVLMMAAGVPLVALAVRGLGLWGRPWIEGRFGFDLGPYLPVVWALLLPIHTAMMFGFLAGLLLVEDRELGLLPALAVTRAGLPSLLLYRLGGGALATAATLLFSLPLAGARGPAGTSGSAASALGAAAMAALLALLLASFCANRLQAMAVGKMLGLPLFLPGVTFFLPAAAAAPFALLPQTWVVWALWAPTPARAWGCAGVALALCAVGITALRRRVPLLDDCGGVGFAGARPYSASASSSAQRS